MPRRRATDFRAFLPGGKADDGGANSVQRSLSLKWGVPCGPPHSIYNLVTAFAYWAATQALASSRLRVPSYSALPLTAPTRLVVRVRG